MNTPLIDPKHILGTVVFASIGIIVLLLAGFVLDKLTPRKMWHEIIENKNVALAIVAGSLMIGMAMIVSAAILG